LCSFAPLSHALEIRINFAVELEAVTPRTSLERLGNNIALQFLLSTLRAATVFLDMIGVILDIRRMVALP